MTHTLSLLMLAVSLSGCQQSVVEFAAPGQHVWSGRWTAQDVSVESNAREWLVAGTLKRGRGCTVADLDLDDDLDLVLANPANESYVLRNESTPGNLHFEPDLILSTTSVVWGYSAADIDGDGDLDLFAAGGGIEAEELDVLLINQLVETGTLSFIDDTTRAGIAGPIVAGVPLATASLEGQWLDFDTDGDLDLWVDETQWPDFSGRPPTAGVEGRNRLWKNQGDGHFIDVAVDVGLSRIASSRFSSWLDLDGDGDLDLHENAMRPSLSTAYRHDVVDGVHSFVELENGYGIGGADARFPDTSFVSLTADFNNDGWDDLLKFSRGWPASWSPHRLGHTLFLNIRGLGLADVTALSNLNDPFLDGYRDHESNGVMGATARDVNGDGLPDVFLGNGGPSAGYPNGLYLTTGLKLVDLGEGMGPVEVPQFENYSSLIDVPAEEDTESGLLWPPYPYRTHAICVADFDSDGIQEAYYMNGGMQWVAAEAAREPDQLFRFSLDPKPRYLEVKLHGDGITVPHTPVGTRIAAFVSRGNLHWVVRDTVRTVEGFAAQHGEVRWLGLADAENIDRVEISWPDGSFTVEDEVELDGRLEIFR